MGVLINIFINITELIVLGIHYGHARLKNWKRTMDWQHFIFDPQHNLLDSMDKVAFKRFFEPELARTAADECLDILRKNNFAKLQSFEGRNSASAKTFFFIVYRRCLEDYYRKVFGRCEPPTWVKQLGSFWATLYKQVCCQAISEPELLVKYHDNISAGKIKQSIHTIHAKDPKCLTKGKQPKQQSIDTHHAEDDTNNPPFEIADTAPDEQQQQHDFEQCIQALHLWLGKAEIVGSTNSVLLNKLNGLSLSDETIVLLRLVYQEGMKVPAAASFIGMEAHTARRRIKEALASISVCFKDFDLFK